MQYVIADTETVGLNPPPTGSGVCQVAWWEIDENLYTVDELESYLVNPESEISEEASAINGITYDMIADAPILRHLVDWNVPHIIIGHNVSFDMKFLGPYVPGCVGTLCTLELARHYFRDVPNHKLQTLAEVLGLERGKAHDAGDDVVTTLSLLKYIITKSGMSLPQLVAQQANGKVYHVMPFGRYKGVKFNNLPLSYITWFLDQDIDNNLRKTFEMQLKLRGA